MRQKKELYVFRIWMCEVLNGWCECHSIDLLREFAFSDTNNENLFLFPLSLLPIFHLLNPLHCEICTNLLFSCFSTDSLLFVPSHFLVMSFTLEKYPAKINPFILSVCDRNSVYVCRRWLLVNELTNVSSWSCARLPTDKKSMLLNDRSKSITIVFAWFSHKTVTFHNRQMFSTEKNNNN